MKFFLLLVFGVLGVTSQCRFIKKILEVRLILKISVDNDRDYGICGEYSFQCQNGQCRPALHQCSGWRRCNEECSDRSGNYFGNNFELISSLWISKFSIGNSAICQTHFNCNRGTCQPRHEQCNAWLACQQNCYSSSSNSDYDEDY